MEVLQLRPLSVSEETVSGLLLEDDVGVTYANERQTLLPKAESVHLHEHDGEGLKPNVE